MIEDIAARVADPEDLRVLVMLAAVLLAGAAFAVAAAVQPFMHRADGGFGFRFVRRR